MDVGNYVRLGAADESGRFVVREGRAPGLLQPDDFRTGTLSHFADAVAEIPVGKNRKPHPRFDEVGDGSLHTRAAGAGDGQSESLFRPECHLQEFLDFFNDMEKVRIKMTDDRLGKRRLHARMYHARTWSEQQPVRGLQR